MLDSQLKGRFCLGLVGGFSLTSKRLMEQFHEFTWLALFMWFPG